MSSAATLVRFSEGTPQPAAEGISVTRVRVFGTWVWMTYRRDERELRRRHAHGLGAVLAWDLLDTLMDLPAQFPVPLAGLAEPARRRLCKAPAGVVCVSGRSVTRELVPPVMPLLAVVTAVDWREGLAAASRFAPYCRRMVMLQGLRDRRAEVLTLARRHGIGVATGPAHPAGVLLEPEVVSDWQPTPAWWRFAETIHGQAGSPGR
jgi:hypothetical protein